MKQISIWVIMALAILSPINSEAFFEFFTVYGERNNQIDEVVRDALNTKEKTWVRDLVPYPHEYDSTAIYIPNGSTFEKTKEKFYLSEQNYSKHPTIHTLKDVIETYKKRDKFDSGLQFNIIASNDKEISFQIWYPPTTRQIYPEEKDREKVMKRFGRDDEKSIQHQNLYRIYDLGNSKFRVYEYDTRERRTDISAEERTYLFELFDYIEKQIENL